VEKKKERRVKRNKKGQAWCASSATQKAEAGGPVFDASPGTVSPILFLKQTTHQKD
jgi:hypothetical protein